MRLKHQLALDLYLGGLLHAILKPVVIGLGLVLRRDHELSRCSDITVLKLRGAGSLAIAWPSLLALRRRSGTRSLRLVTTPAVRGFAEALGVFDEIIVIDDRTAGGLAFGSLATIARLFRTDAIIDLEVHSRLTTVFCTVTCARNRVGFYTQESYWRRGLSTHLLFCHLGNGIYHFYDQLASLFGCVVPQFEECVREFRAMLGADRAGAAHGDLRRVGFAPCCSDLSRERMLSAAEWAGILARFEPGVAVCGLGGKADRPYIDEVFAIVSRLRPGTVLENHAGRSTPAESLRLLSTLDELYCIDTAMLHFARLLGVNTTSFWGPTDPRTRLRPSLLSTDRTYYSALPCSPCAHMSSEAPCRGNNICMRAAVETGTSARNPVWLAYPDALPTAGSLTALHDSVSAQQETRTPAEDRVRAS